VLSASRRSPPPSPVLLRYPACAVAVVGGDGQNRHRGMWNSTPGIALCCRWVKHALELSVACQIVVVTGGTGYIASHIIKVLLEEGYTVRTTVRDPTNVKKNKVGLLVNWSPSCS
jgi:hypothetical protein